MEELLTVREVQDLLKVDRITVYRMLKDGRLTGVKIGTQWRFAREEIQALLAGAAHLDDRRPATPAQVLPIHCVQLIQNVFAEVAEVSALTATPQGDLLTSPSRPCRFCQLILDSAAGRQGCQATWRRVAGPGATAPAFVTCHAGLQCAGAPVIVDGNRVATIIAGQFYLEPPDPAEEAARVRAMAKQFHVHPKRLGAAVRTVPVLDGRKRRYLDVWLGSVAHTFAEIGHERAALMTRLRSIAAMSSLD